MTKAEQTMAALRADRRIPTPQWDVRQRLALALMRSDRQVHCHNCTRRMQPCRVYAICKDEDFSYFFPKDTLMETQLNRVNCIIEEIDKL